MLRIAYCSNVHAGSNLEQTRENLQRFSCSVKSAFSPNAPMGIGLWLSNHTAASLANSPGNVEEFRQFLSDTGLQPFTFNGFPYGDFHQKVVKKSVYLPTWTEPERHAYTRNLIELICRFNESSLLSISTLPLGWGRPPMARGHLAECGRQLRELATFLAQLEGEVGKRVVVCLEPEPGCALQFSRDVVAFFEEHLLQRNSEDSIRRHIAVCHDVCHAEVMGESQRDVFATYQAAGIDVGKVQISSAVVIDFDEIADADRESALGQLNGFAEDRYMHQTTVQQEQDGPLVFFEDLPLAIAAVGDERPRGKWRVHFHVPIYLSRFGHLGASQAAIVDCVTACRGYSDVNHFEVETYAWNVLPPELQQPDLATGIANEMKWFSDLADTHLKSGS